jgi:excisionase family DNA binding protein
MNSDKLALTINEAVAYSGVGRTTLYKLVKEHKILLRKLGKRSLILKPELDAFVNSLPIAGGER